MILTCPSCAARYVVDPAALGREGRRVRCARCSETWYEEAPWEAAAAAPVDTAPAPPPAASPSSAVPARPLLPYFREREEAYVSSAIDTYRARLPAVIEEKPRRGWWLAAGWAALALVAVLIIGGGALFQPRIVALWPELARLYMLLDTLPASKASPLTLSAVSLTRGTADGNPILTVNGQIANVSAVTQKLPRLRLELRDTAQRPLRIVDFTINRTELAAGESLAFATAMPSPPEAAVAAVVAPVVP